MMGRGRRVESSTGKGVSGCAGPRDPAGRRGRERAAFLVRAASASSAYR